MSVFNAYMALSGAVDADIVRDEPLDKHTSYRIGGPCDLFVRAHTLSALVKTVETLDSCGVGWVILGKGSNVLASDEGYRGCVITLGREFSRVSVQAGGVIVAGAGAALSKLVNDAFKASYAGLECCVGVPGTVGGALWMNAGTRREWIGSAVHDVVSYAPGTGLVRRVAAEIDWGYRTTSLPAGEILLEATFQLTPDSREAIASRTDALLHRRTRTQPTGVLSCGSVFKNPPSGRGAAELIEGLGLKGESCGGARISEKHANFIVSDGHASARDVISLMRTAHDAVLANAGVDLTPEVRFLGFEG